MRFWQIYAVGGAVCLAMTFVGYLVGIQPALAEYAAHQAELAELAARKTKASDLARQLALSHGSLEATRKEVEGLPLRLEPATAVNRRLDRLADLCNDSELSIDELQPGSPADAPHYQTVPIRLVGRGSYPACASFLRELRRRFPDTAVRSFESSNPNPARNQATGTFRFELVWYTAPVAK
jgi:Tfp pilus assembly protein PilO